MLRIRLSRTGRRNQPKFRIVVAEHTAPIKGKFLEILGYYHPLSLEKTFEFDKERVLHWISKGALPTDSAASLFKKAGLENMEQYIGPRDFQRKKKKDLKAEAEGGEAPQEKKIDEKKSDAKEDVKEDVKEDAKEEVKEDVKEDAKEDAKEDVKEDAKEDAKEEVKEEDEKGAPAEKVEKSAKKEQQDEAPQDTENVKTKEEAPAEKVNKEDASKA